MTVDDLIRKLRRFARKRGHRFVVVAARGKGSHAVLELDDRAAPVPMHKGHDLALGTLRSIVSAPGVTLDDLE